ncbi:MAG: hypothetical protein KatS3mg109_0593 [Pirellulaceae bacterium]|nr:MAG: hypothetical protein KatS3mg109_0593 [Pirellulaceae bacterium]
MNRRQAQAVLIRLIEKLREQESWCGETHVQKAMYIWKEMLGVDVDFDFLLYKHGPFSFDLRDELTAMRADGLLKLKFQDPGYGPSIVPGEAAESLKRRFPKTLKRYEHQIEFIAKKFGEKTVTELERLATALYVTKKLGPQADVSTRAQRIHALKPHVSFDQAERAVRTVDEWRKEAQEVVGRPSHVD